MPLTTPITKVSATRNFGAEVVLVGANYDEACQEAMRRCQARDLTFIHPFDDEAVIAGQGTIALEMLEVNDDLDAVIIPVGGGGLIGGVACAIKETRPRVKVIGVQTSKLPSMQAALHQHKPVTLPANKTIADGIAVRSRRRHHLSRWLRSTWTTSLLSMTKKSLTRFLCFSRKKKRSPKVPGAVAAAAVLNRKVPMAGKNLGVLISGGNIDVTLLSRIIERGLVKDGRLLRIRIHLPDHPGALQDCSVIADHKANIIETRHDRAYYGVVLGDTVIDITMETRGPDHIAEIEAALDAAGYPHERVQ